jgi:hypothetical protein
VTAPVERREKKILEKIKNKCKRREKVSRTKQIRYFLYIKFGYLYRKIKKVA